MTKRGTPTDAAFRADMDTEFMFREAAAAIEAVAERDLRLTPGDKDALERARLALRGACTRIQKEWE